MKVLLVGGGGREHALAWALCRSPHLERLLVAPGNGGTAALRRATNMAVAADDLDGLLALARREAIDLTIVGPEVPLVAGIVDRFEAAGLRVVGPRRAAAQLEGSKRFAKEFMAEEKIPTARAVTVDSYEEARAVLAGWDGLPVIKASGLAAGKGVYVPATAAGATRALDELFVQRRFGNAADEVVIEERLAGRELSVLALCDGSRYRLLPTAQDHKRLRVGDTGPNTGGMGAFAPSPLATPALLAEIESRVIQPTLSGMARRGTPYVGILYAGMMLTDDGPMVLEFNCRLGDPETQVIVPLLESDLLELLLATAEGRLADHEPHWREGAAVTVILAADGYPGAYARGMEIEGLDEAAAVEGVVPFHAGTRLDDGRLLTDGGRVLAVTAVGPSLTVAVSRAYESVAHIRFEGATFRHDIGRSGILTQEERA